MVDPGSPYEEELARLVEHIETRSKGDGSLRILLTHHHADHIGSVEHLVSYFDAEVLAHECTAPLLPFAVDRTLSDGDTLTTTLDSGEHQVWAVVHTPGHTKGHISLLESTTGELIAGDMVAGVGTILILPDEGDLGDYLNSLALLCTLPVTRVYPAHGPTLPPSILGDYVDHRNMRSQQILAALSIDEGLAPNALVSIIYPELPVSYHGVASLQITTHLKWLAKNSLARRSSDGVWFSV